VERRAGPRRSVRRRALGEPRATRRTSTRSCGRDAPPRPRRTDDPPDRRRRRAAPSWPRSRGRSASTTAFAFSRSRSGASCRCRSRPRTCTSSGSRAAFRVTSFPAASTGSWRFSRPVIAAADAESETAQVVESARCGVVIPPGRPELLAAAIRSAHVGELELEAMAQPASVGRRQRRSRRRGRAVPDAPARGRSRVSVPTRRGRGPPPNREVPPAPCRASGAARREASA
jgi:hypothetical protein